jgi:tRNA-dihydrouridine synthase B
MMRIGSYTMSSPVVLAPMAGVTDRPFRQLCRRLGAAMTVAEMVTANPRLRHSRKTRWRTDHTGEPAPRIVQIAGSDPRMMAQAARLNVDQGAQIIDINMGCPAKKVCNVMAGSALLRDEAMAGQIMEAVVLAVDVPVTLKMRTGWDPDHRNGLTIAAIAEAAGVQALTVHGRTRACGFRGAAEYDTIKAIKETVSIPVVANGDISGPEQARQVLAYTGADAVMIGRGAQGNPWIFREVARYLATRERLPKPSSNEIRETLLAHLEQLYEFYGEYSGVRVARKHLSWYLRDRDEGKLFWGVVNRVENARQQLALIRDHFDRFDNKEQLLA